MKLSGPALDSLWMRVAADVLLRAYEDLAALGLVTPLPDVSGLVDWTPLSDRLRASDTNGSVEVALSRLGVRTRPRVLLLVEGKTELNHMSKLLSALGVGRPEDVRLQQTKGVDVNPELLARYAITP